LRLRGEGGGGADSSLHEEGGDRGGSGGGGATSHLTRVCARVVLELLKMQRYPQLAINTILKIHKLGILM